MCFSEGMVGTMEAGVSVWIRRVFGHQPAKVLVSRPKKPHGPHPDGPLLIALEPRYLFDGAAAATTAGIVHQVDHPGPAPQGPDPLAEAFAHRDQPDLLRKAKEKLIEDYERPPKNKNRAGKQGRKNKAQAAGDQSAGAAEE